MCLQVFDNVVLGAWVHKVRKLRKEKRLPAEQVRGLPLCHAWAGRVQLCRHCLLVQASTGRCSLVRVSAVLSLHVYHRQMTRV